MFLPTITAPAGEPVDGDGGPRRNIPRRRSCGCGVRLLLHSGTVVPPLSSTAAGRLTCPRLVQRLQVVLIYNPGINTELQTVVKSKERRFVSFRFLL